MLKFNCIIVEDEPLSAEILTDYIKEVPWLELKKVCIDAIYAMEAQRRMILKILLNNNADINMDWQEVMY